MVQHVGELALTGRLLPLVPLLPLLVENLRDEDGSFRCRVATHLVRFLQGLSFFFYVSEAT